MSVKLRPLLSEPLLLVVDNEPRLELELTDKVDADSVFSCDSSCVIDRNASLSCCKSSCFSSCSLNLQDARIADVNSNYCYGPYAIFHTTWTESSLSTYLSVIALLDISNALFRSCSSFLISP